ncbi:MAG: hypothetical protein AABY00_00615 [Nanoarchaeota archaeon]
MDRALLDELHHRKIIDKRFVLWWQLGFEGRRLYTQEEFEQNLTTITYNCYTWDASTNQKGERPRSFRVWPHGNVPFFIKKATFDGLQIDCFFSIKPLSHEAPFYNFQKILDDLHQGTNFHLGQYLGTHIRGAVLNLTEEFLFWTPFTLGSRPRYYDSTAFNLDSGEIGILCPIHPTKFYRNLVEKTWSKHGLPQRKAQTLDLYEHNLQLVSYDEFDSTKNQIMVYPAKVHPDRLDLPVFLKGNPSTGKPEILGTGTIYFGDEDHKNTLHYWPLDHHYKVAKRSLIERLGDASRR